MKNKLLKELYDCFYAPLELPAQKQEIEECHQALIEALEKPERRLVLQIIDVKDRIVEDTSIDSFISGFTLAWKLSAELNNYENERLISCRTGRLSGSNESRGRGVGREDPAETLETPCRSSWSHAVAVAPPLPDSGGCWFDLSSH